MQIDNNNIRWLNDINEINANNELNFLRWDEDMRINEKLINLSRWLEN